MKLHRVGIRLVALFLFWIGLSWLRGGSTSTTTGVSWFSWVALVMGATTIGAAVAVWRGSAASVRIYAAWMAIFLLGQMILGLAEGWELASLLLAPVLFVALFGPLGLYVRSEARRTSAPAAVPSA